ncbi:MULTISPECIES: ArsB/NhaD family transporter [Okeania]|uniref:ArsB/NhaD family transporter n=1 Tax=Okeania TaxID=1458928 RepID=UPI000F53AFCD|nr:MULTISPECIES: ArsB/NhaD family transporter [Okeania]NET14429.1 arsenic transporter [Okeania sp. SIO1H6]NES74496.1 arsenic transporter [Okeania sp. SIO1H4]NET20901.1 arsenic transporter [Okeania sp. SIO1H5]NET94030.1 arsenic transporter [Okeania sp. SIO1H2]RQH18246.1 arsenic transporter [Okeania hirsuta]
MGWQIVLIPLIFLGTLILVFWQPKGLDIGFSAMIGACLTLTTGLVSLANMPTLIWAILVNTTFTLLALITISWILQQKGVFRWFGFHIANWNLGSGKLLFVTLLILVALVSAIFANYGSTLLFLPIVIEALILLKFTPKEIIPFLIACGLVADISSLPFSISNSVNYIATTTYNISFGSYIIIMLPISFVTIAASIVVLLFYFWPDIPRKYKKFRFRKNYLERALPATSIERKISLKLAEESQNKHNLYLQSEELLESEESHKISVNSLQNNYRFQDFISQTKFLTNYCFSLFKLIFYPFLPVILFIWAMYIIVFGLSNYGLTDVIKYLLVQISGWGFSLAIIATGFLSAFISAVCNNLPSSLINILTIQTAPIIDSNISEAMVYATIIGCVVGAKITPIGSLSTLCWFYMMKQHGFQISWKNYCGISLAIILPILFISLLSLIIWLPGMQIN